ncbi:MAG: hypothetical protein V9G12_11855 [Microthrixaceae bacterium]
MTIDLNERLGRLADEATSGIRLDHPATLTDIAPPDDGDQLAAARRRRSTTIALAIAAAAAVVISLVVLAGAPTEVRTEPAGPVDDTPTARATAALAALRTTDWTAEFEYGAGTVSAAHQEPDRWSIESDDPADGRQLSVGGVMYDESRSTGDGRPTTWTSLEVDGLPITERLLTYLGAVTCWSGSADGVLNADYPCAGSGATTTSAGDELSAAAPALLTMRLDGQRANQIVIQSSDPEEGPITLTFHYGDVPPITAPDPALVTKATIPDPGASSGEVTAGSTPPDGPAIENG